MQQYYSIGEQIKKIIRYRNRSIKLVAEEMHIKYTTFSAQLNNDTLSADTLFRLAALLDIDLNWLQAVLGYHGPVRFLERELIPRMTDEFRKSERETVVKRLSELISENPASTADTRRQLLYEYKGNMFYLLDVLVNEEYDLFVISEKGKVQYYVDTHEQRLIRGHQFNSAISRRKPINMLFTGKEALDIVIEEMKDK